MARMTWGDRLYTGQSGINFVGRARLWFSISAVLLLISIGALVFRGLNLGIEFTGGAVFAVPQATCSVPDARSATEGVTEGGVIVTETGAGIVRVQTEPLTPVQTQEVIDVLAQTCNVRAEAITSQVVGPTWGAEITSKGIQALVVFLILVTLFLSIYFEWRFAVAALAALAHDIIITVGIYALTGLPVTPATLIGFLTILGYSLYDTVVVFDKVRENTRGIAGGSRSTYSEAANLAVNQTLVRSINTSIVALLPVAAILFVGAGVLGAGTLKDLSLALLIGLAVGTYSSICVATPFLAAMREREPAMRALAKRVQNKTSKVSSGETPISSQVEELAVRGPRNQPKRQKQKSAKNKSGTAQKKR